MRASHTISGRLAALGSRRPVSMILPACRSSVRRRFISVDSNGQPQIDLGDKGDDADDDTPDIAVPFRPNAGQRMLLANLHNRNIILKARQMGFSTLIEVMALDHALFNRDQEVVVIAHAKDAATKLYRKKVCFAYDRLPAFLRELVPTVERSQTQLVIANGSSIEVTSSARGGTPHFLHVSEMGKIAAKYPDKAVEITTGSLQGVPLSGLVFTESTAEGKSGAFYTMSDRAEKKAQAGDPLTLADYRFHFFAWWMMPDCRLPLDQAHRARISAKEHEYFDKVEGVMDVAIDLEQRAWYVNKRDSDFADSPDMMWREYPSTPDECWQASTEGNTSRRRSRVPARSTGSGAIPSSGTSPSTPSGTYAHLTTPRSGCISGSDPWITFLASCRAPARGCSDISSAAFFAKARSKISSG